MVDCFSIKALFKNKNAGVFPSANQLVDFVILTCRKNGIASIKPTAAHTYNTCSANETPHAKSLYTSNGNFNLPAPFIHFVTHAAMKFAKYLESESIPEWRKAYIDYKGLKKKLKVIEKVCSVVIFECSSTKRL